MRSFIEGTVNAGRPVGSGQYSAKMATWGQDYGGPLRPDQIGDLASFILNWEATALAGESQVAAQPTPTPLASDASPVEIGMAAYTASGLRRLPRRAGRRWCWSAPTLAASPRALVHTVPGLSAQEYIHQSIVQPNAYIVPECPSGPCAPNLMPQTFGQTLSPAELDGLVQYLLTLE